MPERSCAKTREILRRHRMTTVCREAACPNQSECFARETATFMILGDVCTRRCLFCSVKSGVPGVLETDEPRRVALAVRELGLRYAVVTSVTRDDLEDEGAGHFAETVSRIRAENPGILVEVLTPDFHNRAECIRKVVESLPAVYNHNVETVRALQAAIRPDADYRRSLGVLETVKKLNSGMVTKSGLMMGLGETMEEIRATVEDLRSAGCDILTLGQYLPPTSNHPAAKEFVAPEVFDRLADEFKALGFRQVFSGPYVRSSYHAEDAFAAENQQ